MSNLTRFTIGCYFPIFLEILIYETYVFLKPGRTPDFMTLIVTIPLFLPLIFFYFLTPYLIFKISLAGEEYSSALRKSIDEIFISEKSVLDENEITVVRQELETTLIPELVHNFRSSYVNNYFTSHDSDVEEYSVLNFYESIFLFSFLSSILSFFNAFITLYLHYNSIYIEKILIADQIDSQNNVLLFGSLMIGLGSVGLFLLYILRRRIKNYISIVNPGLVNFANVERKETQMMEIRAISDFNFDDVINGELVNNRGFMTNLYLELLKERINRVVISVSREKVGKEITWKIYNTILTKLNIEERKKERLHESFLSSPLIKSAQQFAFDKREAQSLQEDFTYFNETLENWDSTDESEKLSAFLLLYRSAESLFRGILRSKGLESGNFGTMLSTLADLGLLKNEEQIILNQVRRHRNYILHRAGEKITIQKKFAQEFISVVENILVRADAVETKLSENDYAPRGA